MNTPSSSVTICTAITRNFVSYARVMARSVRAVHPDIPVFAAIAERAEDLDKWKEDDFQSVPLSALRLPDLLGRAFASSPHELTVLAKPLIMRHLLEQGFRTVLFLDSDILVLDDLSEVIATCSEHAVTLAPHLLAPPTGSDRIARELDIALAGTFNAGFVGVSARPDAYRVLDWLSLRLRTHNRIEPSAGLHHDQRWLDLVPGFIDDVAILRDPGSNVAYWNLPDRGLRVEGERFLVDGGRCRFFHFSGFDPRHPGTLSRHSSRVTRTDLGSAGVLLDRYAEALGEAGVAETRTWPYTFGAFADGVPIPMLARELYRDLGVAATRFGDPFQAPKAGGYRNWLCAPDDTEGVTAGLPRLWGAVFRARPDLQQAFPDPSRVDRNRFYQWIRDSGLQEFQVDSALAP